MHIRRPHTPHEAAQLLHLLLGQILQISQIVHAGAHVALQQLAQNLQAHLQADKALQRPIVKVGGDALPFGFPRAARLFVGLARFALQFLPCAPSNRFL